MNAALLLVDLQQDFLKSAAIQPPAEALTARTAVLLQQCRARRLPVIHVWTTLHRDDDRRLPHWKFAGRWMCVAGTEGHSSPLALRPIEGEAVIHKTGFNAFADGSLDTALRRLNCDTIILAGLHLHACVRTAAVECLERGFQVHVAEEAVASNDPIHAAATRRWLSARCVSFEPSAAILARLDGGGGSVLIHRSPRCTAEKLFEVPIFDSKETSLASASAREAGHAWRKTKMPLRQELLDRIARRLESAAPELAGQMAHEIGKPLRHGLEEVRRAAENIRDVARRAVGRGTGHRRHEDPDSSEPATLPRPHVGGYERAAPLGVVALISPWNNPVAIPLGKIAPALAYGNTVVWKPAPAATRMSHGLLQLLLGSGVPRDAVQIVTGDHTTAQNLANDDNIDAVTLTGSLGAGHAIQEICARRIVPLQAELSGNNAAIVWDDADLAHAAAQVTWGAFGFAGQRCTANRRVIVPATMFERFLIELKAAAERLPWGDPVDETTEIGPVISAGKRDEHAELISGAQSDGAAHRVEFLHAATASCDWRGAGSYAQPAIIACEQRAHALVQEETMSPLLVVQRADDFDQALALCNGVRHGLAASLFSRSPELQKCFLDGARSGILKINTATAGVDVALPFGGWKASGIGPPEHGEGDRMFYTRLQAVYGDTH